MMRDIMVDLETFSTLPNARIVAIGAVKFSTEEGVYDKFYQAIITPRAEPPGVSFVDTDGFHVSRDTLDWWARQSDKARAVFTDPNAVLLDVALKAFADWATAGCHVEDVRLWGNGASFDNVILASAYRLRNIDQPWMFYNDRCYRTLKTQHPTVQYVRHGTHHNALDDAETQTLHLLHMPVKLN